MKSLLCHDEYKMDTERKDSNFIQIESISPQIGFSQNNVTWYDYHNTFSNVSTQDSLKQDVPKSAQPKSSLQSPKRLSISCHYSCHECKSTFSNSSNLKSHLRIHSGERPYVCETCDASFVQNSNLKAHKRVHTGERPYPCDECSLTFSRSSHLAGHKRTHTGERPYICGICQEAFVTSSHLRNHMRRHSGEKPFSCEQCGAKFLQSSSLRVHERNHTDERPFVCQQCNSAFRRRGDLRGHTKLHNDEYLFQCTRCDKAFKVKQYLLKHGKKCGAPPSGKKKGRPRQTRVDGDTEAAPTLQMPNMLESDRRNCNELSCQEWNSLSSVSRQRNVPFSEL